MGAVPAGGSNVDPHSGCTGAPLGATMGPCREPADGDRPAGRCANAASRQGQSQKRGPATGRREARKGGSSRRRDGAPAGASPRSQEDSPLKGGIQQRSAVRRSVPFGLSERGKREDRLPRAANNRGDDACPNFKGANSLSAHSRESGNPGIKNSGL